MEWIPVDRRTMEMKSRGRMTDPTSMETIPVDRRRMEKTKFLKVLVFFSQLKEKKRRAISSLHNVRG